MESNNTTPLNWGKTSGLGCGGVVDAVADDPHPCSAFGVVVDQQVAFVPGQGDEPIGGGDGGLLGVAVGQPLVGFSAELVFGSVDRVHVVHEGLVGLALDCLGDWPEHGGVPEFP